MDAGIAFVCISPCRKLHEKKYYRYTFYTITIGQVGMNICLATLGLLEG